MKRVVGLLLVGALMITTFSGCNFIEEWMLQKEMARAYEAISQALRSPDLAIKGETRISLSGKEFELAVTQDQKVAYTGMDTDELCFDLQNTVSIEGVTVESRHHYADGVAYIKNEQMPKAKESMTAQAFMDVFGVSFADAESEEDEEEEYVKEYDNSREDVNVLTITDERETLLEMVASAFGLPLEYVAGESYKCIVTAKLSKEMVPLSIEEITTCKLKVFSETYSVTLALEYEFEATENVTVPEVLDKENYEETADLRHWYTFSEAYDRMLWAKTATVAEKESFSMTSSVGEEYSYEANAQTRQTVGSADVVVRQDSAVSYVVDTGAQRQEQQADSGSVLEKGIVTDKENGQETATQWANPLYYYMVLNMFYSGAERQTEELKTMTFVDSDPNKLICRYTLEQEKLETMLYDGMYPFFGAESTEYLMTNFKAEGFTENTGELVIDTKTGTVLSHTISFKANAVINNAKCDCVYTYSMTVSDVTMAAEEETSDFGSVAI